MQPSSSIVGGLATLAAQAFASSADATEAILQLVARQVDMRSSFLSHIDMDTELNEIIAAFNAPGGCDITSGDVYSLPQSFCSSIAGSVEPSPLLIEDIASDAVFSSHPARSRFPKIGSYLGVPIFLSDGTFFGTLCAVDPEPRKLTAEQAELLIVLARLLATQIERDRAQDALRESEARYRRTVEMAPLPTAILRGATIVYVNTLAADLLGFQSPDELDGISILQFIHPDARDDITSRLAQVHTEGKIVLPFELLLIRPDGLTVPVEVAAASIPYAGEDTRQTVVIVRDVAGRKRAEANLMDALEVQLKLNDQLERLNQTMSRFVSIVSHEFRTALTGIQGFSEIIRDEQLSTDEIKEFAADINADAKRLNRMITEMLDLDRMESGRILLNRSQSDINAIIREAAGRQGATPTTHPVRLQLGDAIPRACVDTDRLTQVITNLLSNAVKYSPQGCEITIATCLEGDAVHVQVRDEGIGIPSAALETIFDRYGRVEGEATRHIQGTGLGLPISRRIVELHDGRMWVESTVGKGSTFHFTIPVECATS